MLVLVIYLAMLVALRAFAFRYSQKKNKCYEGYIVNVQNPE